VTQLQKESQVFTRDRGAAIVAVIV